MPPELRYLPLDTSRQEIRLLEIVSITPKIVCRFHTVSLLDSPSFCALSYVWGDENGTRDIMVNDVQCSITSSLADAIENAIFHWNTTFPFRDRTSRRLWADALCINQADNQEKGEQVQLMKEVYSTAEMVFCALDAKAPEKEMEFAFHAIKSIATGAAEDGFEKLNVYEMARGLKPKTAKTRRVAECLTLSSELHHPAGVTLVSALEAFSQLVYWKRAWIFQEVVLARRPVFIYRTLLMDLETLLVAHCWCFAALQQPMLEGTDQYARDAIEEFSPPSIWSIHSARSCIELQETSEDENVRKEFQMARRAMVSTGGLLEARDPKDHIYALLGVSDLKLKPDYSPDKSVESVHIDLCAEVMDLPSDFAFEFLFFLHHAGLVMQEGLDPPEDYASWVPNLPRRQPSQMDAVPPLVFDQIWGLAPEIRQWMSCRPSSDEVFIRGRSLFVQAAFVTTIQDQGPLARFFDEEWVPFFEFVYKMLNSPPPPETQHLHPLVTLVNALGADSQETDVWEAPEVLRFIRMLQYILLKPRSTDEDDDSTASAEAEAFGDEFLSNIGLGPSWRRSALDKAPKWAPRNELVGRYEKEERETRRRSAMEDFLSRIQDKSRYEAEIAQTDKDVTMIYPGKARMARAANGGFMFVPWCAEEGDHVVLIRGAVKYFLLRKVDDYYLQVGRCSLSTRESEIAYEVGIGEREVIGIELR